MNFKIYSFLLLSFVLSVGVFGKPTKHGKSHHSHRDEHQWGEWNKCPENSYVTGVALKLRKSQETSVITGVRLYCTRPHVLSERKGEFVETIIQVDPPGQEPVSHWGKPVFCEDGVATEFSVKYEEAKTSASGHKTVTNIKLVCSNGQTLKLHGHGKDKGSWNQGFNCSPRQAICGLQSRVVRSNVENEGNILTDARVHCCHIQNPAAKCVFSDHWHFVADCDNSMAEAPETCGYEKKIGTSYSGKERETTVYENVGFTLSGVATDLAANAKNLKESHIPQYKWSNASLAIWMPEEHEKAIITVNPGFRKEIYQAVGFCGFYRIRSPHFKITEAKTDASNKLPENKEHQKKVHSKKGHDSYENNDNVQADFFDEDEEDEWAWGEEAVLDETDKKVDKDDSSEEKKDLDSSEEDETLDVKDGKHKDEIEKKKGDEAEDPYQESDWFESEEDKKSEEKVEAKKPASEEEKNEIKPEEVAPIAHVQTEENKESEEFGFDDSGSEEKKPEQHEVPAVVAPSSGKQESEEKKEEPKVEEKKDNSSEEWAVFDDESAENKDDHPVQLEEKESVPEPHEMLVPEQESEEKKVETKVEGPEKKEDSSEDFVAFDDESAENKNDNPVHTEQKKPEEQPIPETKDPEAENPSVQHEPVAPQAQVEEKKDDTIEDTDFWENNEEETHEAKVLSEIKKESEEVDKREDEHMIEETHEVAPLQTKPKDSIEQMAKDDTDAWGDDFDAFEFDDSIEHTPEETESIHVGHDQPSIAALSQKENFEMEDKKEEPEEEDGWFQFPESEEIPHPQQFPEMARQTNEDEHHGHDHSGHLGDSLINTAMKNVEDAAHDFHDKHIAPIQEQIPTLDEVSQFVDDVKEMPIVKDTQKTISEMMEDPQNNENNDLTEDTENVAADGAKDELAAESGSSEPEQPKSQSAILGYIVGGMVAAVVIITIVIFVLERRKPKPKGLAEETERKAGGQGNDSPLLSGYKKETALAIGANEKDAF